MIKLISGDPPLSGKMQSRKKTWCAAAFLVCNFLGFLGKKLEPASFAARNLIAKPYRLQTEKHLHVSKNRSAAGQRWYEISPLEENTSKIMHLTNNRKIEEQVGKSKSGSPGSKSGSSSSLSISCRDLDKPSSNSSQILCRYDVADFLPLQSAERFTKPVTVVYTDEEPASKLNRLFFYFRCVLFGAFDHVQGIHLKQTVSKPITHSIVLVRSGGASIWKEAKARYPNAGVIMFADEEGRFDQSINSLSSFAMRNYWLDKMKHPAMYVLNGFNADPAFLPHRPRGQCSGPCVQSQCSGATDIIRASRRRHFFNFVGSLRRNRSNMISVFSAKFTMSDNNGTRYKFIVRDSFGGPEAMYLEVLSNSAFTLCPCGNNAETHRLWEALHAGSIPVVERCSGRNAQGWYAHISRNIPHLVIVDSWSAAALILQKYNDGDVSHVDHLQRLVFAEFLRYLHDTRRDVFKLASRAWNASG